MTARIAPIDPKTATGRAKEIFEGPLKGKEFNIFKSMANSSAALDTYASLSAALAKGQFSAKEREVVQLTLGQANNCDYCVAAHTVIGKGAGLTEEQTIEARRASMKDAKLNALSKFVMALHEKKGFVSDSDFQAFTAAGYSPAHAAEALANYTLALYTNYFNHMNNTPIDFPAAPKI
ncbi:MAG: carboxymuconolactone decarboxylase family protein [Tepidisphaera sp.]|nr:carboxymuconolactone decarboxylase family protein [Tepidisphaera sp.]